MKIRTYHSSLISIIFILSTSLNGYCQDEEFKLQKVTENLYMIGGRVSGNVSFLVTEEGVLCVDAKYFPYQGEKVVEIIRQITDKPIKYLLYTHCHGDHTQGAQSFSTSTVIVAHQNTLRQMEKDGAARIEREKTIEFPRQLKALEEKVEKLKAEQSPKLEEAEKELELKRFQISDYERLKLIFPDITFERNVTIHLGSQRVELIYLGNGHTEGDILVYFPNEKAIHTGDLFGYPGEEKERMKDLNYRERLKTMEPEQIKNIVQSIENVVNILEKSLEMDFEKAIPGHGNLSDKNGMLIHIEWTKQFIKELRGGQPRP